MYGIIAIVIFSTIGMDSPVQTITSPFFILTDLFTLLMNQVENLSSIQINNDFRKLSNFFDDLIFIAIIGYLVSRKYTISDGDNSSIKYKPLTFHWETSVYFRLRDQTVAFDDSLLRYLINKKSVKYGFIVHISDQGNTTVLVGIRGRRFLPIRVKKATLEFVGLFHANGFDIYPGNLHIKNNKLNFNKIKLKFNQHLPYGIQLINGLQNLRELNVIVTGITNYHGVDKLTLSTGRNVILQDQSFLSKFKLVKPNEFKADELKVDVTRWFNAEVDIYLEKQSKPYLKSLMAFLESISIDTKRIRILRGRTKYPSTQIYQLFNLPNNPTLKSKSSETAFYNPDEITRSDTPIFSYQIPIGYLIQNGKAYKEFGLDLKDLKKGGLIAGAIGTGKTNFRLNLMHYLLKNDVHILDFDLKGDAGKQVNLSSYATNIIIGDNLRINPFECPQNVDQRAYAEMLFRSFIETLPDRESLTPPQLNLLQSAIKSCVNFQGDSLEFLENILIHAMIQTELLDNYQESSAQALMNKLSWLYSNLRDVFWVEQSTHSPKIFALNSLFFDFSRIRNRTPINLIKFLINFILTQFILNLDDNTIEGLDSPNHVIFIDEGQLLMPKSNSEDLTKLEEAVVTMRSRGVSIVSGGVSADLMSETLLDSGLIVQFRSASTKLARSLSLNDDQLETVISLKTFESIIRAESTMNNPVLVKTNLFNYSQSVTNTNHDTNHGNDLMESKKENLIPEEFEMNMSRILKCRLVALFPEFLTIDCSKRRKWWKIITQLLDEIDIEIFVGFSRNKSKFKEILKIFINDFYKSEIFSSITKELTLVKYTSITIFHYMATNESIRHLFPNYKRNFKTAINSISFSEYQPNSVE
jgi:hypothetical protein